jgi:hypothetical protein
MKIWSVEEYILNDEHDRSHGEYNGHWEFSSKEKAIQAVYDFIRKEDDLSDDDIKNKVEEWEDFDGDLYCIETHYGDDYGLYDCRYDIWEVTLDERIEH